jgi:hypothetical protein
MQGNARKRYLSLRQTDDDDQALFRTLNPQDSCFAAAVVLRASVRHTAVDVTEALRRNDPAQLPRPPRGATAAHEPK